MKRTAFIIALIVVCTSGFSQVGKLEIKDIIPADSLVTFCKQHLGTKYNYANCTPADGFDCSGFVYFVFSHFNIKVPRSSADYAGFGKPVPMDSAKTGDVIVFTGTDAKRRKPGHVGIVISKPGEDLSFIHSSSDKRNPGIKISNYSASPNYKKRFLKIVRVALVN
jgi:cell wall-associated NlpC family hydrolase